MNVVSTENGCRAIHDQQIQVGGDRSNFVVGPKSCDRARALTSVAVEGVIPFRMRNALRVSASGLQNPLGQNMKKVTLALVLAAVFLVTPRIASAMSDRPYTDGPVSDVTFIRTKPGMFDDYMKW